MFDLTLYKQVREKYKLNHAFPTLYKKIKPEINVAQIGEKAAKKIEAQVDKKQK